MTCDMRHSVSRRRLLQRFALGFGGVALTDMLARRALADPRNAAKAQGWPSLGFGAPHFTPRAKRVIYIFLDGGFSHIDSFDHKPLLQREDGKPLPLSIHKPKFTFAPQGTILKSPWTFKQYGRCGKWASNLFPHINEQIDDLTFIHSLRHDNNDHFTAKNFIHTGSGREVRPTLGSWLVYGLGSENENLPAYIDITPDNNRGRPSAFLPAQFAGTPIRKPDKGGKDLQWDNLAAPAARKPLIRAGKGRDEASKAGDKSATVAGGEREIATGSAEQREHLNLVQKLNRLHLSRGSGEAGGGAAEDAAKSADAALEAEIANMELAFRMQAQAPGILSLHGESEATMNLYGIGEPDTTEFGRALLLARRFAEAGVRYITVTHSTTKYGNLWDQHGNLFEGHSGNARAVDKPVAGFLRDLRSRGMLDDTLVMFGSEFGRTPTFEFMDGGSGRLRNGRDHNPYGFTMWFAGGGMKPGTSYGATDDYGYHAVEGRASIHDLHATILHLMGIDHEKLTHLHAGRDHRLTDVYGDVVRELLA